MRRQACRLIMLCHQPPRFDWCPQSIYTIYSSFHIASAALEQHLRSLPCAMSLSFSLIGRDKTMQCYSHRTYLSVSRRPNNTEVMDYGQLIPSNCQCPYSQPTLERMAFPSSDQERPELHNTSVLNPLYPRCIRYMTLKRRQRSQGLPVMRRSSHRQRWAQ